MNLSNLKVGDSVIVKSNVTDPDFGIDIGDWQGRISEIDKDDNIVGINWDSLTLKELPSSVIEKCKEEGWDWTQMYLEAGEVELTTARDTEADVVETVDKLKSIHEINEDVYGFEPVPKRIFHRFVLEFGLVFLLAVGGVIVLVSEEGGDVELYGINFNFGHAIIFIAILAGAIRSYGWLKWREFYLLPKGTVQAIIVDRVEEVSHGKGGTTTTYYIIYWFTVPETGRPFKFKEKVDKDLYDQMSEGTLLEVEYALTDPRLARRKS